MSDSRVPITLSSPLHIIGAFLCIIQERFKPGNFPQWVWDKDYNTGTNLKAKPIAIEAMYTRNNEARNVRPAIYVGRDTIPLSDTVIGDTADHHSPTGKRTNMIIIPTTLRIIIEATSLGEAEILAHIVGTYLSDAKDILVNQVTNWRKVGPVTILPPSISKKDKRYTTVPITVALNYQRTWNTEPIAPKLQEVLLSVQNMDSSPDDFHLKKTFYSRYEELPDS